MGWCRCRRGCWVPWACCQGCQQQGGLRGKPFPHSLGPRYSCIALFVLFYVKRSGEATWQQKARGGGRPSSYPHSEIPRFSALAWALQGNSIPGHSLFAPHCSCALGQVAHPTTRGTHGTCSPGSPGARGESQRAKRGVGSSSLAQPALPCRAIGASPPWGARLMAGRFGDLGTCHGFSSFF